jgi:Fe-S cluster assembly protein SufD
MASSKHSSPEKIARLWVDQFESRAAAQTEAPWLQELRRRALARVAEQGFPTTADEDWRFTNLAPLWRMNCKAVTAPGALDPAAMSTAPFWGVTGPRLVFVDGIWSPGLSEVGPLPPGIRVSTLGRVLPVDGEGWAGRLGAGDAGAGGAFGALNTAWFTDGAVVEAAPGAALDVPVQVVYLATRAGAAVQVRNVVSAAQDSRLTVVESFLSLAEGGYFTNVVTDLVAGPGAQVEHLRLQDEHREAVHLGLVLASLGAASRVHLHSMALGSRLSRTNLRTYLGGAGLECILNGLYLTRGEQLADHHMVVEHAQPQCASHEYFNGILDDRSRGVFHGRILVRPAAQKTDAKQTNKNLLLSDEAQVNTKPQLEIYADDVKCTHGATVGQLNEESVFYLRARGIGLERAKRMLIHAFAGEIIERVQHEGLREVLDRLVWDRLEQNPHIADAGSLAPTPAGPVG